MDKKLFLLKPFLPLVLLFFFGFYNSILGQSIRPVSLRCEYQENPIGIDIQQPSLNWFLETTSPNFRNQNQSAYHLLVASSPEILSNDIGDLWDSGIITSDQNTQIIYHGKPLNSLSQCYWKVRVWDNEGIVSNWSRMAVWKMGLLNKADWQGSWIGRKKNLKDKKVGETCGYCSASDSSQNKIKWIQIDLGAVTRFDQILIHPALPVKQPDGHTGVSNPGFGFPVRFRLDGSNDPGFKRFTTLLDHTDADLPNPGLDEVRLDCAGQKFRYVRFTATKLWNSGKSKRPFYFCLGELQVISGKKVLSLNKPAQAFDSTEGWGWSKENLTDGINLAGGIEQGQEALYLRKETNIQKKIVSATAFVSGLGYYELTINGTRVSDRLLDPGFTNYTKRVLYATYDVTNFIKKGLNCIGVILGNGWYNFSTPDAWGYETAPWVAPSKLLLNIVLEFEDGSKSVITSDETWKLLRGPIVFNSVRSNEVYDARLEIPGWNLVGYPDSKYRNAKIVPPPAGRMVSQQLPPIRATQIILPIGLREPVPGVYVFDLGTTISGWARFQLQAKKGDVVKLFYNEHLNADGTVRYGAHSWHTYGSYQTDKYISNGKGNEIFEPRFTYHGFRYIQVSGLSYKPELGDLKGVWIHTDPDRTGEFSCSNPKINKVQELLIRTQLNNLHSIPTDCPHREKIGWMGDGLVTMEEAIYNFDMATFYIKWFHDMLDAQESNGHVPPIVPNPDWVESTAEKNPEDIIPAFSDPWWGGALIITPWNLYQYYGDQRYLKEGYENMKKYLNWIGTHANDYVFVANLGDWVEPAMLTGGKITPKDQVGTSAYFYFARLMSQIAKLLEKPADGQIYLELAEKIRTKYNRKFFDETSGLYLGGSELSQTIPLLFKMVPKGKEKIVEEQLINEIVLKQNNHLSTGIIGTPLLFRLLTNLGYEDLAYTLATQEDSPGWFYMLKNGATTIWEVWDALANIDHSRNHPALGAIGAWYYQSLAGIQPDPDGPGFKKIIIKPEVVGDLNWAKASYRSVHGVIESNWKRKERKFFLNITIPVNTSATVFIPAIKLDSIFENNKPIIQIDGIRYVRKDNDKHVFEVGSGNYFFSSQLINK